MKTLGVRKCEETLIPDQPIFIAGRTPGRQLIGDILRRADRELEVRILF